MIMGFFLASNQHIRIISEGSCDTEDWSNDAENCFDGRKFFFYCIQFYCIFDQINAALVSIRDSFQQH